MGFKQHISRTWQMIEQQVNDVPFRPHNEAVRLIKSFIYAGFRGFESVKKGILPTIYPRLQELS